MADKKIVEKIKIFLLRFGIISNIYESKGKRLKDKSAMYQLHIYENNSRNIFMKEIGFISTRKNKKLSLFLKKIENNIKKPIKRFGDIFFDKIQKIEIITDDCDYIDINVLPSNVFFPTLFYLIILAQVKKAALFNTPVVVPRDSTERPESILNNCSFMLDVNSLYNAELGRCICLSQKCLNRKIKN